MGKAVWQPGVIQSILSNVKYKGDALLGKTYIEDCISKKVRINSGERAQYYVENNHPAIINADTFAQVQEELARRASKRKVKQIGTTTEQGKYCGKYALTELLVCGECGTPYRRCNQDKNDFDGSTPTCEKPKKSFSCGFDIMWRQKRCLLRKARIYRAFLLPKRRFFSVPKHRCKIAIFPLWIDLNSRKVNIKYTGR